MLFFCATLGLDQSISIDTAEAQDYVEYELTGLDSNTTYYIAVAAFDEIWPFIVSDFSNEVSGVPNEDGTIVLRWDHNTEPIGGYMIYYSADASRFDLDPSETPYLAPGSPIDLKIENIELFSTSGGGGGGCFITVLF